MTLRSTLRAGLSIALASAAFPVSAADVKSFHGGACRPVTEELNESKLDYSPEGAQARQSVDVICPLVRDWSGVENGISLVQVEFLNPSSGGSTIACTLFTQGEDGGAFIWDSQNGSTSTTGRAYINFNDIETSSGQESSYAVRCALRTGDYLMHVHLNERTTGSG